MGYTDKENVELAKQEYEQYKVGEPVTIGNGNNKKIIGYVAEVINNEQTGEQAYIITDGNPTTQKPGEVNHVTILYQGSLGVNKTNIWGNPSEIKRDWWDNNKEIAGNVLKSYDDPSVSYEPTKQMKSSAKTLNDTMDKYYNATFNAYGHSQSSSNIQYALAALNSKDKINRIGGAFIYQGPNAYAMLTKKQRETIKNLKGRIFNFVDTKDIVPIGYRLPNGQMNPFHIGTVILVDSKKVGKADQHMWGGYRFVNGNLLVAKESLKKFQEMKHQYNQALLKNQLNQLDQLEKKLTASGGGLSTNEQIYLDDSKALFVLTCASSEFDTAMLSVVTLYQKGIQEAEELWRDTLSDARSLGEELSEGEILDALASVSCTKETTKTTPSHGSNETIKKVKKMSEDFHKLTNKIQKTIDDLVQKDQELAKQLRGIGF